MSGGSAEISSVAGNGTHSNDNMTGAVDIANIANYQNTIHDSENKSDTAYNAELNSMGIEAEAEEDTKVDNKNVAKNAKSKSLKKKSSKEKIICEEILDIKSANPGQIAAIKRIATRDGLGQIKRWLEQADKDKDAKRLTNLLAQLYHADVSVDVIQNDIKELGLGKVIGFLSKHGIHKDVKKCASEIRERWTIMISKDGAVIKKSTPTSSNKTTDDKSKGTQETSTINTASTSVNATLPVKDEIEEKSENKLVKQRPKTVRRPNAKFRSTGLEEDETDGDASKNQTSSIAIPPRPVPLSKLTQPPPKATISNVFSQSLSNTTTMAGPRPLVRKRNESATIDPIAVKRPSIDATSYPVIVAFEKDLKMEMDGGPNPSRVPAPDLPRKKRRIHFADDKGEELVLIKEIEPRHVLPLSAEDNNKSMKGADMSHEKKILDKNKNLSFDDGDEEAELSAPVIPDASEYRLVPYMPIDLKEFCPQLIEEENKRTANTMLGTFYLPDAPSAPPSDEDPGQYTYTEAPGAEGIPQIALEVPEVVNEPSEELMDTRLDNSADDIQILQDVDIHKGQGKTQPVSELVILEHDPAQVTKPVLKTDIKMDDIKSILQKVKQNKSPHSNNSPTTSLFGFPPPEITPKPIAGDLVEVPLDIHAMGTPTQVTPRPLHPRAPFRHPNARIPQSSGVVCQYYLKGTCTFGDNCYNLHPPNMQNTMHRFPRMNARMPRFNNSLPVNNAFQNPPPLISPTQTQQFPAKSSSNQDGDNEYRSSFGSSQRESRDRDKNDSRRSSRYAPTSPPTKKRYYRSDSRSPSPEYNRRRSPSPEYNRRRSPSPEYNRRRRMPKRSPSRSPI